MYIHEKHVNKVNIKTNNKKENKIMPKPKVSEFYSDEARMQMKEVILDLVQPKKFETVEELQEAEEKEDKLNERRDYWRERGIDIIETSLIGPFTIDELMEGVGLNPNDYPYTKRLEILGDFEDVGATMNLTGKENEKGLTTIDLSEDTKKDINKKEGLSLWDKILAFFGIQTEHAHKVEMDQAAVEAIKDKQKELNDRLIKRQMKEKRSEVLQATRTDLNGVNMANEKADAWRKIFFPNETPENKVSDYTLDNGKKVSSVSLCMAVLQQTTKNDLSAMGPNEFKKMMDADPKLQNRVKKVGDIIKDMAQKSNMKKFKYADQMLGTNTGLLDLDDKLKNLLKPGEKAKELKFVSAGEYNQMDERVDEYRDELFSNMAVMFKVKDDMVKIFGKDDEIYGMKNDPEAAKMEQHVKMRFKTVALRDAFEKENYDKALKIAGYGNDYSKLEEVTDLAVNMGLQVHNEKMSVKYKEENTFEDIEYDMGNEL